MTAIHVTANACFERVWHNDQLTDENGYPLPEFLRDVVESCFPADSRLNDMDWCEIVAECSADGWHDPGVCSGPPEACYPPECEIEVVVDVIQVQRYLSIGDHTRKQGDVIYLKDRDDLYGKFRDHFEDEIMRQVDESL